jgi:hypothetical protein
VTNYWAVGIASADAGWLVGGNGAILKLDFSRPSHNQAYKP